MLSCFGQNCCWQVQAVENEGYGAKSDMHFNITYYDGSMLQLIAYCDVLGAVTSTPVS